MAAPAVAAVAKKVIVYILTDEKALKVVLGIVLGIIIIILLPLGVILGVLNGDVEIDADRIQELIVQNLSAEEQAMLQGIETLNCDNLSFAIKSYLIATKRTTTLLCNRRLYPLISHCR